MIELTDKLEELVYELKKAQPETFYHCLRVKRLVSGMLIQTNRTGFTNYSDKETEYICKGALLHDIGKLFVNSAFLTKPAALSKEEMENLKRHARLGADAVRGELKDDESEIICNICRYHHERTDGSGYEGKTELPMYVQIVSVCDVFDAINTDRVYRAGRPAEAIYRMLRDGACGQLNKTLLDYLPEAVEIGDEETMVCVL